MYGGLVSPEIWPLVLLVVAWTLPWKGYALWLAARNGHKLWFVALLIVNTVAILEIIYIFAIGRPQMKKREGGSSGSGL